MKNIIVTIEAILHPTRFKKIMIFQQNDKSLIKIAKEKPNDYSIKYFHGAGKTYSLTFRHGKIVIPKQTQKSILEWYHNV